VNRRSHGPILFATQDAASYGVPLLREIETVTRLTPSAFAASTAMDDYLPRPDEIPPSKLFVPDAFVNPEHVRFALRGCLAASACYVIYSAVDWPGLSTSVTTYLVTALTTIGASRQKQILRLAGFFIGAVILGMGVQIFILPGIDSITAFTLLFLFVTVLSAWIMTASPRLSHLGFQLAFGFYYINWWNTRSRHRFLSHAIESSGLGSASAGREMKQSFIAILRLLASFASAPLSDIVARRLNRPTLFARQSTRVSTESEVSPMVCCSNLALLASRILLFATAFVSGSRSSGRFSYCAFRQWNSVFGYQALSCRIRYANSVAIMTIAPRRYSKTWPTGSSAPPPPMSASPCTPPSCSIERYGHAARMKRSNFQSHAFSRSSICYARFRI
jgi:hypothetical protein